MNDENNTTDSFEARLVARMHAVTDGLEPTLGIDELAVVPSRNGRGPWLRVAASGLVAAALIGGLAWITRSDEPSSVGSASSTDQVDVTSPSTPADSVVATTAPAPASTAKNFLVVGTDNGSCTDASSPFAPGIGDRTSMGERSDTMMVIRIDPAADTAAMLSFPRDLWVEIAGRSEGRLNSALTDDDPQRLIDTIFLNFGVPIDHFVQIDLCAFKTIVDAVGGVAVPFDRPARDRHTGLDVPVAGCVTLDGDHALAYVRSRNYEYLDDSGVWRQDPTSDLGRIGRQQQVVRQVLGAALDLGIGDLDVARDLLDTVREDIVLDDELSIAMMMEYVGVLTDVDPSSMAGFQIEVTGRTIAGNAVLLPTVDSPAMVAVLAAFRGEAPIAGAASAPTTSVNASGAPTPTVPTPITTC